MFTIEQIKQAHSKVKTGQDFPFYIREIKSLGVTGYETFVTDGHTDYFGATNFCERTDAKYDVLSIAEVSDALQFIADLRSHQQGNTDYPTFCKDCAKSGIEKWKVSMDKMTCTYFDKMGNEILTENIPQ